MVPNKKGSHSVSTSDGPAAHQEVLDLDVKGYFKKPFMTSWPISAGWARCSHHWSRPSNYPTAKKAKKLYTSEKQTQHFVSKPPSVLLVLSNFRLQGHLQGRNLCVEDFVGTRALLISENLMKFHHQRVALRATAHKVHFLSSTQPCYNLATRYHNSAFHPPKHPASPLAPLAFVNAVGVGT